LHFAAIEEFEANVMRVINKQIPNLILRFRRADHIGSSGIMALKRLKKEAEDKGINVFFSGLSQDLMIVFQDAGLAGKNPEEFFYLKQKAVFSSEKAIIKAIMQKSKDNEK